MSVVRTRRLQSDFERLTELARRHPRIAIVQAIGAPPDRYQLRFEVRSVRLRGDAVEPATEHLVEIALPAGYPRMPPHCRMLTPVFHPNIAPHAICIGDHWSPGESLSSIVIRIAEMLGYQSYNVKSPLNGEAARWAEREMATLPLDRANMWLDESAAVAGAAAPVASSSSPPPPIPNAPPAPPRAAVSVASVEFACGGCGATLRAALGASPRVRCPRCRGVNDVPTRGRA